MDRFWLKSYPPGTPADIDPNEFASVAAMIEQSLRQFREHTAFLHMGRSFSYAELDTDLGHDSFLLESEALYALVRGFLERNETYVFDFAI